MPPVENFEGLRVELVPDQSRFNQSRLEESKLNHSSLMRNSQKKSYGPILNLSMSHSSGSKRSSLLGSNRLSGSLLMGAQKVIN